MHKLLRLTAWASPRAFARKGAPYLFIANARGERGVEKGENLKILQLSANAGLLENW